MLLTALTSGPQALQAALHRGQGFTTPAFRQRAGPLLHRTTHALAAAAGSSADDTISAAQARGLHNFSPHLDGAAWHVLEHGSLQPDSRMACGCAQLPPGCSAPSLSPGAEVFPAVYNPQCVERDLAVALQLKATLADAAGRLALAGQQDRLVPLVGYGQTEAQGGGLLCYLVYGGAQLGSLLQMINHDYHGREAQYMERFFHPEYICSAMYNISTTLQVQSAKDVISSNVNPNMIVIGPDFDARLGPQDGMVSLSSVQRGELSLYHTTQFHVGRPAGAAGALQSTDVAAFGVNLLALSLHLLGLRELGLTPAHLDSSGFGRQQMAAHLHLYMSQRLALLGELPVRRHPFCEVAFHMAIVALLLSATGPNNEILEHNHMQSLMLCLGTTAAQLSQAAPQGFALSSCGGLLELIRWAEHLIQQVLRLPSDDPAASMAAMWHLLPSRPTQLLLQAAASQLPLPRPFHIASGLVEAYHQRAPELQQAASAAEQLRATLQQGAFHNWGEVEAATQRMQRSFQAHFDMGETQAAATAEHAGAQAVSPPRRRSRYEFVQPPTEYLAAQQYNAFLPEEGQGVDEQAAAAAQQQHTELEAVPEAGLFAGGAAAWGF